MIYKIKTEEEIRKFAWQDPDGDYWISKKEHKKWESDIIKEVHFYAVVEKCQGVFDSFVSNDKNSKYFIKDDNITDKNFEILFSWIAKYELTKESHPEFFI